MQWSLSHLPSRVSLCTCMCMYMCKLHITCMLRYLKIMKSIKNCDILINNCCLIILFTSYIDLLRQSWEPSLYHSLIRYASDSVDQSTTMALYLYQEMAAQGTNITEKTFELLLDLAHRKEHLHNYLTVSAWVLYSGHLNWQSNVKTSDIFSSTCVTYNARQQSLLYN